MSYATRHWRIFNVLARVFGLGSIFTGFIAAASGVSAALHPPAPNELGVVGCSVMAAFLLTIGVLFLRVRPYRPDVMSQEASSWWTGEPKSK